MQPGYTKVTIREVTTYNVYFPAEAFAHVAEEDADWMTESATDFAEYIANEREEYLEDFLVEAAEYEYIEEWVRDVPLGEIGCVINDPVKWRDE